MTRKDAIFYIKELQKTYASMDKKVAEAVDMAIEALSARPIRQTDALIIADALRYLEQDEERHEMDRATATSLRKRILKYGASLSARPTDIANAYTNGFVEGSVNEALKARPKGEWISIESEPYCKCSACGTYIDALDDYYSFCPFCGADMRGDDDV